MTGRRHRKLPDDLKERRGYSHLKEEALDCTVWRAALDPSFNEWTHLSYDRYGTCHMSMYVGICVCAAIITRVPFYQISRRHIPYLSIDGKQPHNKDWNSLLTCVCVNVISALKLNFENGNHCFSVMERHYRSEIVGDRASQSRLPLELRSQNNERD